MFSKIGQEAIKKGLDNIIKLCAALDNPQLKFPFSSYSGYQWQRQHQPYDRRRIAALPDTVRVCMRQPHLVDLSASGSGSTAYRFLKILSLALPRKPCRCGMKSQPSYFEVECGDGFHRFCRG